MAVPLPCTDVFRIDILPMQHRTENSKPYLIKWTGHLPTKLPTLLVKMEKSFDNEKLLDSVLKVHFYTLQEEWAKWVNTLSSIEVNKIK